MWLKATPRLCVQIVVDCYGGIPSPSNIQHDTNIFQSMQQYAAACKSMQKYAKVCESMQKYERIFNNFQKYAN